MDAHYDFFKTERGTHVLIALGWGSYPDSRPDLKKVIAQMKGFIMPPFVGGT